MANDIPGTGDFITGASPANDQTGTTVWVSPDPNAPEGCGRIMLSRPGGNTLSSSEGAAVTTSSLSLLKSMLGVLSPENPKLTSNVAVFGKSAANDNSFWVGEEDSEGDGVFGSDVDAATLADGSTVVSWIGPDRGVHAKVYPAEDTAEASADALRRTAELNDLLAELGGAGQRAGAAEGRLKLSAFGQGGLAALWVADFGFTAALMGKVFLLQADPSGVPEASGRSWSVTDLSPVAVPRFASNLSVSVAENGQLSVGYQSEPGAGGSSLNVSLGTVAANQSGEDGQASAAGSDSDDQLTDETADAAVEFALGSGEAVETIAVQPVATSEVDVAAVPAAGQPAESEDDGALGPLGNDDVTLDTGEIPAGSDDGLPVVAAKKVPVLSSDGPGTKPGTQELKLTIPEGPNGEPTTVVVSTEAIVEDVAKPHLDLAPVLDEADGGSVLVAYVSNAGEGDQKVHQLNVQLVKSDGELAEQTVVTVAPDEDTTYSDFDVSAIGSGAGDSAGSEPEAGVTADDTGNVPVDGAGSATEAAPPVPEVAVVWVENANESGYGNIVVQRFSVEQRDASNEGSDDRSGSNSGSSDETGDSNSGEHGGEVTVLVAIGRDGASDGNDGTFNPGDGRDDDEPVVGRAPQVEGCGNDKIAIAWVEQTEPGVETIAGEVFEARGGNTVLAINLTGLITHGIVAGSQPKLMSDDAGDIVIGWVQDTGQGQFEAAAAVYRALADGGWSAPSSSIVLKTFDYLPADLVFNLSEDGAEPLITLAWSNDRGRVYGAEFDLDGNQDGGTYRIRGSDAEDALASNDSDLSVAGLADASIVVLYSEANGNDTTLGAVVVPMAPGADAVSDNGLSEQVSDSRTDLATVVVPVAAPDATVGEGSNSGSSQDSGSGSGSEGSDSVNLVPGVSNSGSGSSNSGTSTSGDGSGPGSGDDAICVPAAEAESLVVVDFESDLIRVFEAAANDDAPVGTSNSGSGSSSSGKSDADDSSDCDSDYDDDDDSDSDDWDDDSDADNSGKGSENSGNYSELIAVAEGYGNDVSDYYEEDHVFDVTEPIADVFDALQFANALVEHGNGEVLVFDATNIAMIRDFETI